HPAQLVPLRHQRLRLGGRQPGTRVDHQPPQPLDIPLVGGAGGAKRLQVLVYARAIEELLLHQHGILQRPPEGQVRVQLAGRGGPTGEGPRPRLNLHPPRLLRRQQRIHQRQPTRGIIR
ncbi:MAG: hypothetical protein ACK56I_11875, partial [bacterium]